MNNPAFTDGLLVTIVMVFALAVGHAVVRMARRAETRRHQLDLMGMYVHQLESSSSQIMGTSMAQATSNLVEAVAPPSPLERATRDIAVPITEVVRLARESVDAQ